jgi:hypothetical protein
MLKKILIISLFLFATFGFSASDYDKDITVLKQSRNDKVVSVFKEMMKAYEEEDLSGFFSYVSEDRFIQDYMTFYDAIDKDMRVYDILNVDTWVDKITEDGIKRYLYVTWEKRYQSVDSDRELYKKGYSRFLFDEINGKYKLIGLAGNNFWGGSLAEWREEVPQIAGQEIYAKPSTSVEPKSEIAPEYPDLTVSITDCSSGTVYFKLKNIGDGDTTLGRVEYDIKENGSYTGNIKTYDGDIAAHSEVSLTYDVGDCYYLDAIKVDPNNFIEETDENNNVAEVQPI